MGECDVIAVDCRYMGAHGRAVAYLLTESGRAAFVDNNTSRATPLLMEALAGQGLGPEAVDYLIVTHVHLDHAGGTATLLAQCPNATILAHPRAARHLIDPARLVAGAKAVYGEEKFEQLYGVIEPIPASRVHEVSDGEVIDWGGRSLRFLHVRGHANHHMVIHDSRTNGVFSGDAFGLGRTPAMRPGPAFLVSATAPADFDPDEARIALRRIVETGAAHVFLAHYGRLDAPASEAAKLEHFLDAMEAIMAAAGSVQDSKLDDFCMERVSSAVDEQLRWCGVADFAGDRQWIEEDVRLNALGVAHAVRKRRAK